MIDTTGPLRSALRDFGVPAVFSADPEPVTALVLFDDIPETATMYDADIETTGPQLTCFVADIPAASLLHGAQLTIGDQGYTVAGVARYGAEAQITLREVGP